MLEKDVEFLHLSPPGLQLSFVGRDLGLLAGNQGVQRG